MVESPTVRMRRLARILRELRERAGLSTSQAAAKIGIAQSQISRIESRQRVPSPTTVVAMAHHYGVAPAEIGELEQLARASKDRGWWAPLADAVHPWFNDFIGLEGEASSVQLLELIVIPGLLQTEDYARAVTRATQMGNGGESEVERRVELRLRRQQILTEDNAPTVEMVLDESALRRTVGDASVMSEQLTRAADMAESKQIRLQILPLAGGVHPGMLSSFTILSFPEPADQPIVYVENESGGTYEDRSAEVERYKVAFAHLRQRALEPDESVKLVRLIASDLTRSIRS